MSMVIGKYFFKQLYHYNRDNYHTLVLNWPCLMVDKSEMFNKYGQLKITEKLIN